MNTNSSEFNLVGARFSKIVVDERAIYSEEGKDLSIEITRSKPEVSKHKYGERSVIELRVSAVATMSPAPGDIALDHVFNLECTGGFVSEDSSKDGDLAAFSPFVEQFSRSLYWVLRERLDSVFAITTLRGFGMPWDLTPQEAQDRQQVVGPPPAGTKAPDSESTTE
jgi:hypothetical protein